MMKKTKSRLMKFAAPLAAVAVMACGASGVILTGCDSQDPPPTDIGQEQCVVVTLNESANGTVTADKDSYVYGDTVTLTFTPDYGYEFHSVKVDDADMTERVRGGVLVLDDVRENIAVSVEFVARQVATVAVSVKDNIGGTASVDNQSAYIGDQAVLTVSPSIGYEAISVTVNGAEKIGDVVGNKLTIPLTQATTSVIVEYYEIPIEAVAVAGEHGSVSITDKKDKYSIGDELEAVFTPDDGCVLKSVLVNGVDKTSEVVGNKLTITVTEVGNINVSASFDIMPVSCTIDIKAVKYGAPHDLSGTALSFVSATSDRTYRGVTVGADGKLSVELVPDTYSVETDGFVSASVTIEKDKADYELPLVFQAFKPAGGVNTDRLAQGELGMGSCTYTVSKDGFDDFIYEAKLKHTGERVYIAVYYTDTHDMLTLGFNDSWEGVNFMPMGAGALWDPATIHEASDWKSANLTDAEKACAKSDGLTLKLVRKGSKLYVFAGHTPSGGEYSERLLHIFGTGFSTGKAEVGICNWTSAEMNIPVSISTDTANISALVASDVTTETVTPQYGEISLDKTSYDIGDTVTVTVVPETSDDPNTAYVLKSLAVDGTPVTDSVKGNAYTFTASAKAHRITAEFEQVSYANLNVKIGAQKYGASATVSKIWLTGANYARTEHVLDSGVLNVDRLTEGEYSIEADGFIPVKVTVEKDKTDYADITLQYQIFDMNHKDGSINTDTPNSATLGSAYAWITSKDEFAGDVMFTTAIKKALAHTYFSIGFMGEKQTILSVTAMANVGNALTFTGFGGGALWQNNPTVIDADRSVSLTADEQAAFEGDGLTIKLVRKGNILCLFAHVGDADRLLRSWDVTACAGQKIKFGVCTFGNSPYTFDIAVSQDGAAINALTDSTVTASVSDGDEFGSVALDKPDGKYSIGETVTVTLTPKTSDDPNTAYTIESLTVDGHDVTDSISNNMYSFTTTEKTHRIVVQFASATYATLDVKVKGLKYGVEQAITRVMLSNTAGYNAEHVISDGTLEVDRLVEGEYTIAVDGYIPVKVTVARDNAAYSDITLDWQIFDPDKKANININRVQEKYEVEAKGIVRLKDTFSGNFIYTTAVKHFNQGGGNRVYFLVRFTANNKVLCAGANNDAWHGIHCMDVGADAMWSGDEVSGGYLSAWDGMALTDAEWAADQAGELILKFARKGNKLYLIVGHTASGVYSERIVKDWNDETLAGDVQFGYINYSNDAFSTPIGVTQNAQTIDDLVGDRAINANVTFDKYGVAENVSTVTLKNSEGTTVEATLADGKLTTSALSAGVYTLEAEGYAPHKINLPADASKPIKMKWYIFKPIDGSGGDRDKIDDGYISLNSWGYTTTEDISENFVYSAKFKHTGKRIYMAVKFSDGKMLTVGTNDNMSKEICNMPMGAGALWTAEYHDNTQWKAAAMTDEEWTADQADGVTLKLVRNAKKLYVFIGYASTDGTYTERLLQKWDDTDYPEGAVSLGICNGSDGTVNIPVSIDITAEAVNAMLAKLPTE